MPANVEKSFGKVHFHVLNGSQALVKSEANWGDILRKNSKANKVIQNDKAHIVWRRQSSKHKCEQIKKSENRGELVFKRDVPIEWQKVKKGNNERHKKIISNSRIKQNSNKHKPP
jgi:hypothetical protein